MIAAHNCLARVHGFSPIQWAQGREWFPGGRLVDSDHDVVTLQQPSSSAWQLRKDAEKVFLDHRAREHATRANNTRTREHIKYLPGDLIFYRRYQHPADLPSNSMLDYPRLRTARWYGPARVLACETKVDGSSRRPSSMLWAIAAGRLKKFHATQVRHALETERLVSSAASAPTFPWTFTSLTSLLQKGSYDDETKPKRRTWGRTSRVKAKTRRRRIPEKGGDLESASACS